MKIDAIDSVVLAAGDLAAACRPYERLGLKVSPARDGRRTLWVGGPGNSFAVHFQAADPTNGPLVAVALRVADLDAAFGELKANGVRAARFRNGNFDAASLPLREMAGTDLILVTHGDAVTPSPPDHSFPLLRLDHLAAITHDLEEKSRFWAEVLGVPVAGEVVTPAMVIRQLRIGDAVLELLGPASPDSPVWQRPPGLVGMASWEVADLDAAVALARSAGVTVTDPAVGVLPGTRVATAQGADLAGVNMQLLQYV